jgi:uncharacterized protein (DUF58 family)
MPEDVRQLSAATAAALGKLPLLATQVVEGFITGLHASPFHGFSNEFAEHRKYVAGDALRDLDWRAYARTDRYYIKRYKEETNLRCRLLLDTSASMRFASGETSKLQYACRLAACLAYLCHRQRDAVGLCLCGARGARDLAPSAKAAHLVELMRQLESVEAGGVARLENALEEVAERMHRRGLVVVLSDLLDNEDTLLRSIRHLRHRLHEVVLFHILDPAEEELPYRRIHEFVDLETGEELRVDPQGIREAYRAEIEAFRRRFRGLCHDRGIDYAAVTTSEGYEETLFRFLARRARA